MLGELLQLLVVALLLLEELLLEQADVVVVLDRAHLLALEPLLAGDELGEVDEVAVEVGPLDAGELHLLANRHTARPAHPGAVDHDRVERHHGLDAERASDLDAGAHHRQGAYRHDQIRLLLLDELLQGDCDEARLAVAAVVGADHEVVGERAELVLPEDEVLVAEPDDSGRPVPGLLEGAELRVDRRDAEPAADEHHVPDLGNVLGQAEGAHEVREGVAGLVVGHHLAGRLAERLNHHRDGAAPAVEIGNRQRDALGPLVESEHDEVAGLCGARDVGRGDLPEEGHVGEDLVANDGVHGGTLPTTRLAAPARPLKGEVRALVRTYARRPTATTTAAAMTQLAEALEARPLVRANMAMSADARARRRGT